MNIRILLSCAVLAICAQTLRSQEQNLRTEFAPPQQRETEVHGMANPYPQRLPPAGISPIAISIVTPAQFPSEVYDIVGLRLNLFTGTHNNVGFLDIGVLANKVCGDLTGIQLCGIWNEVDQRANAIQLAGIANSVKGDMVGLQISTVANYNLPTANMNGFQIACVNTVGGLHGFQVGLYNETEELYGLQIGLVNMTQNCNGLQIGLINVIKDSTVPFMPILNFAF